MLLHPQKVKETLLQQTTKFSKNLIVMYVLSHHRTHKMPTYYVRHLTILVCVEKLFHEFARKFIQFGMLFVSKTDYFT